jgi:kinetochore protein Nuf2
LQLPQNLNLNLNLANVSTLSKLKPAPFEMSYNPRMSIVPQQQNRGKKKEEDSDAFMRLVRNSLYRSHANVDSSSPTRKS